MRFLVLFVTVLLLGGCTTATGPAFQRGQVPAQDQALVYVYRPVNSENGGLKPRIHLNGQDMGILQNGGFLRVDIAPGAYTVSIPFEAGWEKWAVQTPSIEIALSPGSTSYVRLTSAANVRLTSLIPIPGAPGVIASHSADRQGLLEVVAEPYALGEISSLRESKR